MSNFMPFVPSDLSAIAQPPENAVNEQTDRWTDRQTNNNIHKHPWMLNVSHLDTSACQIVGHFFQALCMQYTNPSPWMVGRTDERMKWQQYPSASMLAKGKSSGQQIEQGSSHLGAQMAYISSFESDFCSMVWIRPRKWPSLGLFSEIDAFWLEGLKRLNPSKPMDSNV